MFWPVKMSKVRLIGLKTNLKKTIESLEEYGGVEIKKLSSKEVENSKALEENTFIVEKLVKTEALLNALEKKEVREKISISDLNDFSKQKNFGKVNAEIEEIISKISDIDNETEILKDEKTTLKMFAHFDIDFSKFNVNSIELVAGTINSINSSKLEDALTGTEFTGKTIAKGKALYLIAFEKGTLKIDDLGPLGFDRIQIPNIKTKPGIELKNVDKKIVDLEKKKASLKKDLEKVSKENYAKLTGLKEHLENESSKASLPEKFLGTSHSFVLEGYLPEKNFEKFKGFIKEKFGKQIFVQYFSNDELEKNHETTPTLTEHSYLIKPFESLVKFISIPKSNELDTTMIFLIFFPVFYGMIVGDFVYGILSFLIAKLILKKFPTGILNSVSKVWMWGSIPTIIFGVIFDEYAGFSHHAIFELIGIHGVHIYYGYERLHNIELLLGVSLLLGVFTIAIGFLLGFINASKHGNKRHAMAKLGWFGVVLFGTILITTLMFNSFPQDYLLPTAGLFIVSLIPIVMVEGIMGIMELPSVVGNILSFARILAVGLVGVVIASILNDMAFPSLDKGLLLIIFFPLYIFGHLFNAFLAMFESLIQGARLNFVEFYSKFYEGDGKEFVPFKVERKYTKE
ncbi:MAG: V-type ATP synthase subunit I [archaeon]|nr:V-type ATP synthase subunit I [archaeon]